VKQLWQSWQYAEKMQWDGITVLKRASL